MRSALRGKDIGQPGNGAIRDSATPLSAVAYAENDAALAEMARGIVAARRRLASHLDAALFANPGLDIMMFLFAEGVEGGPVTTNACCAAAGVPRTTALRWVKLLQDRGLVDCSDDVSDRRVTMLALTDRARDIVRLWLTEVSPTPPTSAPDPAYR